jgi:antitoxin ParD1/3/4
MNKDGNGCHGMTNSYRSTGMAKVSKRTFSLSAEHAAYIDTKVDSGADASGSEVIRAGLRAPQERDAAFERWLREEAVAAYDATKSDPSSRIPAKSVFAETRARYSGRRKARR